MDRNVGGDEGAANRGKVECRNDLLSSKEGHRMTYNKHRRDIRELTITGMEKVYLKHLDIIFKIRNPNLLYRYKTKVKSTSVGTLGTKQGN